MHLRTVPQMATVEWLPNNEVCAACGKFWGELLPDEIPTLCKECSDQSNKGEAVRFFFGTITQAERLEKRFEGLFRAARVLLRERADESRVIPTLAFEGVRLQRGGSGRAWDQEQAEIYENHSKVRPVEVMDGALILQWREVAVVAGIESEGPVPRRLSSR
jgi:hypothetical protein